MKHLTEVFGLCYYLLYTILIIELIILLHESVIFLNILELVILLFYLLILLIHSSNTTVTNPIFNIVYQKIEIWFRDITISN